VVRVYLLPHGFQQEYEVGFANGLAAQSNCEVIMIASDNTLVGRLASSVKVMPLRGSQESGRGFIAKVCNMAKYWFSYFGLAIKDRRAIFHFNGLFSMRGNLAVLLESFLARLFIRNWVLSVHNLLPHDSEGRLTRIIYGIVYRLPNLLVVHTKLMRQSLIGEFGVSPDKIVIIEHGIDLFSNLDPADRDYGRKKILGVGDDERVVLSFGKVMRYKGLEEFIVATDQFVRPTDQWVFVIAGVCADSELRESISSKLAKNNNGMKVIWFDRYIEHNEASKLLAASDVMVMPYRKIDQSGVIFTALSYGVPVVATNVGSLCEYASLGGGCVVGQSVDEAFIGAIRDTLKEVTWSDRSKTVERARTYFEWCAVLKPLVSSYEGIVE